MPDASEEALLELVFLYEVLLTYVLTRKGGDQVGEAIDTRVRAGIEEEMQDDLRIETFNSNIEMPRMIQAMEEIENTTQESPLGEHVRGVVATNIISHGVDIDRFNLMVFAGLPKQMAEYIQASARVGRRNPGISFLVITPQADRDRSVYDRFEKFHEYLDRLVEPVPANRWSEPALELTINGVVTAYLMGVAAQRLGVELYFVGHVKERFGRPGAEALNEGAVLEWVIAALGADRPDVPRRFRDAVETLATRCYGRVTNAAAEYDDENLNTFLGSMRSLRDVDEPASIRVWRQADQDTLRGLGL
jgi:hypothetical protein